MFLSSKYNVLYETERGNAICHKVSFGVDKCKTREMIYLDNAATTRYVPDETLAAFIKECNLKSNSGRSGHKDAVNSALKIQKVREYVCDFFGNSGGETIFTKNCTEALNIAILGTQTKGHIVTTVTEHNSVLRPLSHLEKTSGVSVSFARPEKNGRVTLERIRGLITPQTYLVIINACSNVTGTINDYENICKYCAENGIRTLVDVAQLAGHKRINMKSIGADMLACSGHKGLYGLQGTGFLTFNPRIKISPILFGGTGTSSFHITQPTDYPEALEAGTLNGAGIVALGKSMEWVSKKMETLGIENEKNSKLLVEGLKKIHSLKIYSTPNESGIVSFIVKGRNSEELADFLNENNIAVRGGLHCAPLMHKFLGTAGTGLVRVSFGYNNTERDVLKVLKAVERFVK